MPGPPVTREERQRILDLHSAGLPRNRIAAQVGRSPSTVSRIAAEAGRAFDRTATRAATRAAVDDARRLRAQLALDYLRDAQRLRQRIWEPHVYWDWGGRDHHYDERQVNQPTPVDQYRLMQASTLAAARSLALDVHDSGQGAESARSMIGALAAGLHVAYDALRAEEDQDQEG